MTENDWLTHNLHERLIDPNTDLKVTIKSYDSEQLSFKDASDRIVQKIADLNKRIFVSLSGGMDSEYVLKCFMDNKILFDTIEPLSDTATPTISIASPFTGVNTWVASTAYTQGQRITYGFRIYEVIVSGTSSTSYPLRVRILGIASSSATPRSVGSSI